MISALVGLFAAPAALFAALGEVSVAGSTWTGKIDGVVKYTGSSMAAAVNACSHTYTYMWIRVYNGGNTNGQMRIFTNQSVDAWNNTISGNGGVNSAILYSQNSNAVGAKNMRMAGVNNTYGVRFSTCQGNWFSGVNGQSWLGMRIDNCKGGGGSDLQLGNTDGSGGGSHAYETYGINRVSWGTATCTDRGECGVLLNYSSNATGTNVNSTRCCVGGGYAGFRTANTNSTTNVATVNSNNCGRGYFSVSGSQNATINRVFANNCTSHGVWLQSTRNTRINGGTVTNCHPCSAISQDLGGNTLIVTCR